MSRPLSSRSRPPVNIKWNAIHARDQSHLRQSVKAEKNIRKPNCEDAVVRCPCAMPSLPSAKRGGSKLSRRCSLAFPPASFAMYPPVSCEFVMVLPNGARGSRSRSSHCPQSLSSSPSVLRSHDLTDSSEDRGYAASLVKSISSKRIVELHACILPVLLRHIVLVALGLRYHCWRRDSRAPKDLALRSIVWTRDAVE